MLVAILGGLSVVAAANCGSGNSDRTTVLRGPAPALAPYAAIDAEFDDRFGLITHFDVVGCDVVVYDHGVPGFAVVSPGAKQVAFFGRKGQGPGEFTHPRWMVADSSGRVVLFDWVQRRLVAFTPGDRATTTMAAPHELATFGLVGRIVSLPGGGFADLWASDYVASTYVSPEELARRPLVVRLNSRGQWTDTGWGTARVSQQDSTVLLHLVLQFGDVAVSGDTLFVLNAVAGDIQLFSISRPSSSPARTIALTRHFTPRQPAELNGYRPAPNAEKGAAIPRATTIADKLATVVGVVPTGEIVVVANEVERGIARERLDVYDRTGKHIGTYALPTRSTRTLRVLRDGSVVLLANRDQERLSDRSVLFFRIPQSASAGAATSCGW